MCSLICMRMQESAFILGNGGGGCSVGDYDWENWIIMLKLWQRKKDESWSCFWLYGKISDFITNKAIGVLFDLTFEICIFLAHMQKNRASQIVLFAFAKC